MVGGQQSSGGARSRRSSKLAHHRRSYVKLTSSAPRDFTQSTFLGPAMPTTYRLSALASCTHTWGAVVCEGDEGVLRGVGSLGGGGGDGGGMW